MAGFFSAVTTRSLKLLVPPQPQCWTCKLDKKCASPRMPIDGDGARKILICGEGPGENEDLVGRPFVGPAGDLLKQTLRRFKCELTRDCWIMNAIACRASDAKGKNRQPTDKEIGYCRPTVVNAIKALKPELVILLGKHAVKSVIGWLWKEDPGEVTKWVGWRIPNQQLNAWVAPVWHPSHVLRSAQRFNDKPDPLVLNDFEKQLEWALKLKGRPWPDGPPDYKAMVRVELDANKAAAAVRKMTAVGKPLAFDYETTTLKPDGAHAEIYSCSVSDGVISVAYPWHGEAIQATKEMLLSDSPKIGQHIQFEIRWSLAKLGVMPRNWKIDDMLASHVADNRRGITGAKFMTFALLGGESYDDEIKPFLTSKGGGNSPNRIREAPLQKLLLYNGMDSLVEWHIAQKLAPKMGLKL